MKQPNIPQIPKPGAGFAERPVKESRLWIVALILALVSIVLAVFAAWHGFILGFLALACGVIAFVLVWKEFEWTKKMLSLLILSICAAVLGFYSFGAGVYNMVQMMRFSYPAGHSFDSDDWNVIDEPYFDFEEDYDFWD